jgi:beta-ribofuranosylaminobenzene 5'-phosphate synthase
VNPPTTAQDIHAIEEKLGRLSNLQKVLLSTDGSVTGILEMVTGHPIEIRTLKQQVIPSDEQIAGSLEIDTGEEVNHRVVELRDGSTGEVLIYAVSHTPLKRLAPAFRQDLMQADIPIGRIIMKHRIESRREVTDAGVLTAGPDLSGRFRICREEPLLTRKYRIIHHKKPLIAIEETFPYNKFLDEFRVVVDAPARLHLALIDLNGSAGRVDGGVGVALDRPSLLLEAERSETLDVTGGDEDARRRVRETAATVLGHFGLGSGVSITLRKTFSRHAGLGSGTQLALATAGAICSLYGKTVPAPELARMTGRGGTSGIGSACFASGGFILDGGHRFGSPGGKQAFSPSSASREIPPAPVISRLAFPEDWRLLLVIPEIPSGASGGRERDIFSQYCPVPLDEVREICHEVLMRMLPGIAGHDLDLFAASVNRIQEIGFKRVEHSLQPPLVSTIMEAMQSAGAACAGMSSFGPTLFAVGDTGMAAIEQAARGVLKDVGGEVLQTGARNTGAEIRAA